MRSRLLGSLLMLAAIAAIAAIAVIAAIAAAQRPSSPLLGVVRSRESAKLVRIDPQTLRPRPGRGISVESAGCAARSGGQMCVYLPPWSFSPGRSLLAAARNARHALRSLRLVDPKRMRVVAEIAIAGGPVSLIAWLAPARLLALQESASFALQEQQLIVVDVARPRAIARRALGGSVLAVARTPGELVLLVGRANEIGPARLAIVDRAGRVRFRRLARERSNTGCIASLAGGARRLGSRTGSPGPGPTVAAEVYGGDEDGDPSPRGRVSRRRAVS